MDFEIHIVPTQHAAGVDSVHVKSGGNEPELFRCDSTSQHQIFDMPITLNIDLHLQMHAVYYRNDYVHLRQLHMYHRTLFSNGCSSSHLVTACPNPVKIQSAESHTCY